MFSCSGFTNNGNSFLIEVNNDFVGQFMNQLNHVGMSLKVKKFESQNWYHLIYLQIIELIHQNDEIVKIGCWCSAVRLKKFVDCESRISNKVILFFSSKIIFSQ